MYRLAPPASSRRAATPCPAIQLSSVRDERITEKYDVIFLEGVTFRLTARSRIAMVSFGNRGNYIRRQFHYDFLAVDVRLVFFVTTSYFLRLTANTATRAAKMRFRNFCRFSRDDERALLGSESSLTSLAALLSQGFWHEMQQHDYFASTRAFSLIRGRISLHGDGNMKLK